MTQSIVRVLFLLLVAACVSVPASAASIQDLERQLNGLDKRVKRMENQIQVLLGMLNRIESLQSEIQLLRGDSERALHEMELVKERQRQLYMDIDQRIQSLEGGSIARAESRRQAVKDTDTESVAVPGVIGADRSHGDSVLSADAELKMKEQRDYKQALGLVKEKRYDDAVTAFTTFLVDYPQSESADNAQYWLAEANYGNRNYAAALVEFKKVIDNYPESSKIPGAALKLGYSHYELAQWEQARNVLTALRDDYPNTSASRLADERLKRMKREGH